jgi:acetylornithine aminotransferase/acetylornithine/N-succinyldiaminopimelate aminotransferase
MQAVDLDSPELAKAVAKELLQEGIIINRTHETVLRFLAPYIIQKKHVDQLVKALDAALHKHSESGNKRTDKSTKKKRLASAHGEEIHAHA